jgi:putative oxidoreductase
MKLGFPNYDWLITAGPATVLLALLFLYAGGAKLIGMSDMVQEFAQIGIGQWFRYFTGFLEVGGAIGVLIPKFRLWAALLISTVMLGATVANLTVLHLPVVAGLTIALMAQALTIAWQWRASLTRWRG